jgi:hypothetical protein
MRSIALMHAFDRDPCVRTHITAHGARLEVMEARATARATAQGYGSTWSALERAPCVRPQLRSIAPSAVEHALAGTSITSLQVQFALYLPCVDAMSCTHKTLKTTKNVGY